MTQGIPSRLTLLKHPSGGLDNSMDAGFIKFCGLEQGPRGMLEWIVPWVKGSAATAKSTASSASVKPMETLREEIMGSEGACLLCYMAPGKVKSRFLEETAHYPFATYLDAALHDHEDRLEKFIRTQKRLLEMDAASPCILVLDNVEKGDVHGANLLELLTSKAGLSMQVICIFDPAAEVPTAILHHVTNILLMKPAKSLRRFLDRFETNWKRRWPAVTKVRWAAQQHLQTTNDGLYIAPNQPTLPLRVSMRKNQLVELLSIETLTQSIQSERAVGEKS